MIRQVFYFLIKIGIQSELHARRQLISMAETIDIECQ